MSLLIYASAAGTLALAWSAPMPPATALICLGSAAALAVLGASFHYLDVRDEGDQLRIQFGPLPLFATSIRYNEITLLARDRSTFMEGWGIHKSFRGGWVWNIWGRDCLLIEHDGKTRVGTDDLENLLAFLSERTGIDPC